MPAPISASGPVPASPAGWAAEALVAANPGLVPVAPGGNETHAWAGAVAPGAFARVSLFGPIARGLLVGKGAGFVTVSVGWGEIRSAGSCPMASGGMAHATGLVGRSGGVAWRVVAVGPYGRTVVPGTERAGVVAQNVLPQLLALAPVVGAAGAPAAGDASTLLNLWASAAPGLGAP